MTHTVFIEVGPLQEIRYAGISNVTLNLCRYWLQQPREASCFFLGPYLIDRGALEIVVEARSGGLFQQLLIHKQAIAGLVANEVRCRPTPVALFPNVKSVEGIFGLSFQIVHDISFLVTPEFHHADTLAYHGLAILKDLGTSARTFCVSHATAGDLATYLGVPAGRITVIYPGADPPPEVDRYTQNLPNAEPSRPYIVVPGTIEPRKNLDTLLDAWQSLRSDLRHEFELVIAGIKGWSTQATIDRICAETTYLGYVPEAELPDLIAGATAFVYPSLYEGFGFPVAQAMAAGSPVLTANTSCLPEVAGDAALFADPLSSAELAAGLTRLLESEDLRTQLIERGRQRAELYRWSDCARKSLEFFRSIGGAE